MKTGRRLAVKLLNAARFSLADNDIPSGSWANISHPLDRSAIATVKTAIDQTTAQLNQFDYASALSILERSFWSFCDFYIELSKERVYGADGGEAKRSAQATLKIAIETYIRCFAPYLPFVTEEIWSGQHDTSVHSETWPTLDEAAEFSVDTYEYAVEALRAIRAAKGRESITVGTPVEWAELTVSAQHVDVVDAVLTDIKHATRVDDIRITTGADAPIAASIGAVSQSA